VVAITLALSNGGRRQRLKLKTQGRQLLLAMSDLATRGIFIWLHTNFGATALARDYAKKKKKNPQNMLDVR